MKIVNKKTGEVIDLTQKGREKESESIKNLPKSEQKKIATESRIEKSKARIRERGTIQDTVSDFRSGSTAQKILSGVQLAAAPLGALESSVANPMLRIQDPGQKLSIGELIRSSQRGITLQEQGQFGDLFKNAGLNPVLSDMAGLALVVSPIKVVNAVSETFGSIAKVSDKGLMRAGTKVVDALTEARNAVGTKVGQEYDKVASHIPVDGLKFLDDIADVPAPILKRLEAAFGKMEDFAQGLTVGKLREFKTHFGKLKPNAFGQEAHGIEQGLEVKDALKAYGRIRARVHSTISDAGVDKKVSAYLMKLDDTFSTVMDARRFIKRKLVDPITNIPSKAGSFAKEVLENPDQTARLALSEIKKVSSKTRNLVNDAMKEIKSFERWRIAKGAAAHTARAIAFGGIAGGVGGRILSRVQGDN
jgi:hypothetical protein